MNREDLADLNAFMIVAEEQSFTRAASRLGTSQSALSHTIRRLETRLGLRLLTRTTRRVATTHAGEKLLGTLAPALDAISSEIASLSDLSEKPSGLIRLTTSEHAATSILWPALKRLLPDYPGIQVDVEIEAGLSDIVAERFDAGIRLEETIAKDMIAVPIGPPLAYGRGRRARLFQNPPGAGDAPGALPPSLPQAAYVHLGRRLCMGTGKGTPQPARPGGRSAHIQQCGDAA